MRRTREVALFFTGGFLAALALGACGGLARGGSTEGGFRLSVNKTAAVLRDAADRVDRHDLTPRDGYIDEWEWADLVLKLGIEMRKRSVQADAAASGR